MDKINKYEWSIYSIPGSLDVTIGGCIGNDVHGKDSFKFGNFGENVIEIEVILSDKKIIKCSKETNKEIFKAVIGGLGLIGIITKVKLKLKKINSSRFRLTVFRSSRNISAQIIDDKKNKTLISATSISKKTDNINKKDLIIILNTDRFFNKVFNFLLKLIQIHHSIL